MSEEIDYDELTRAEPTEPDPPEGEEKPPPGDEPKPDEAQQKTVPLAALHEERQMRKALQQELRELQGRMSKVDALEEQLKKMREPPPAPEPEFVEDPKAYIDHHQKVANDRAEAELQRLREGYQRVEAQTQATMFQTQLRGLEESFVSEHEDYYEALGHVRKLRIEELQARGYDEDQIKIKITQDELELAAEALGRKANPAEIAYKRAQAYGYSPKAADNDEPADDRHARAARAQSMGSGNSTADVEALMAAPGDVFDEVFRELKFGNKMK